MFWTWSSATSKTKYDNTRNWWLKFKEWNGGWEGLNGNVNNKTLNFSHMRHYEVTFVCLICSGVLSLLFWIERLGFIPKDRSKYLLPLTELFVLQVKSSQRIGNTTKCHKKQSFVRWYQVYSFVLCSITMSGGGVVGTSGWNPRGLLLKCSTL